MKKINDWKQQPIIKIEQTANNIRQQLKNVYTKHRLEINELFTQISQQLNKSRIENNYIENDIKLWLEKLNELKKDFQTPKTINIHFDENKESFITIIHGPSYGDVTLRGKKGYDSGIHRFRFQIEKLGIPKGIFFSIISKNDPLQSNLYKSSSVYGWAGHHYQYDGY